VGALTWDRFQFGFTIVYHYLFPQLTMGLALLLPVLKLLGRRANDPHYDDVARFLGRIFAINFTVGVVTGIPLEFQFGTNWSRFSAMAGGVIGITLALEGLFAFFAESAFIGLFLFGEKKLSKRMHFFTSIMVWLGSWASGYFIIVTNAFMQHPVGHSIAPDGTLQLDSMTDYLFNEWAVWEFAHTMSAAVITAAFVVSAIGAYWALRGIHAAHARITLRTGVIAGLIGCMLQLFPTGDRQGKLVAEYQQPALAAMEAKFETSDHAEMAIIGQPDVAARKLDNPITVPWVLSFLSYGSFGATVHGLDEFPQDQWPDNVELLYYSYHVMVGLGTLLMGVMGLSALLLLKDRLLRMRPMLWVLLLAFPFPYIATTAGWMTAELGRQPWVIYGIQRTADASSPNVSAGNVAFSTLGFLGLYFVVGITFLYLVARAIAKGPAPAPAGGGH
jgi:cytochrome d ubiquinol oxidase subunit I